MTKYPRDLLGPFFTVYRVNNDFSDFEIKAVSFIFPGC